MALTEKVKINWKFQEDNLAWNDLQLRSCFVQSCLEFPHLRGIFGASEKNDLKSALLYMHSESNFTIWIEKTSESNN